MVNRYWLEVWGNAKLDLVDELIADPYIRHNRNGSMRLSRKQVKQDLVRFWQAVRAATVTIEDQATSGDRVWSRVDVRGLNLETGEEMVVNFVQVVRIADGRMAEAWSLNAADVDWRRID